MGSADTGARPTVLVRFDAEIRLLADDLPVMAYPAHGYAELQQAVQDVIGHTGAVVIEVIEYEEQPS